MSELYITKKYYDKFTESDALKIINLYGYSNRDEYFKKVCKYLNEKYPFLKITKVSIMSQEESSEYSMYNGFVKGTLGEYSEFLVSFSDPWTKEGNTIISQQLMPMLQERISNDMNFLYDKKIKRVFLLTSHKVSVLDASRNSIKEDTRGSTLQLLVRCLVTLGFDVYPFIPIINLQIGPKFKNVKELIDDIEYIKEQNPGNLQHKQIELITNKVVGSFSQKPKGQDEKYFAMRYLTAIVLNNSNEYDVSQAYSISGKSQMMGMLFNFSSYVQLGNLRIDDDVVMSDQEFNSLIKKEDDFLEKLKSMAEQYGIDGTRVVQSTVRLAEVQDELRKRLIKKVGCKCMMCNTTNNELMIASHIKPASECNIFEKGDLDNVFLLCAAHDKLFDRCLISFNFLDGKIMISNKLTEEEKEIYKLSDNYELPNDLLTPKRIEYLMWHNEEFEKKNKE